MKAKRSPVRGPLLTFALMIGSVVAVGAAAHFYDMHQKAQQQTVSASAGDSAQPASR
jgi:hypothetical protein